MTPCRTLAAFILAACLVPAPALAADSPDNLDIVWARANRAQTPVYADASASSKVLVTLRKDDLVHIAGTRTVDGETWYNVVSYELTHDTDGWIRGSDTWFSPLHAQGFEPATHQLYDRMRTRLAKFLGNYPDKTRAIYGKPFDGSFKPGRGETVTMQRWRGLTMVYSNSSTRKEAAWITYVDVTPGKVGREVAFGPVRLGSDASVVRSLADKLGRDKEGKGDRFIDRSSTPNPDGTYEMLLVNGFNSDRYCFRFVIGKDGKVIRMEHRYAYP